MFCLAILCQYSLSIGLFPHATVLVCEDGFVLVDSGLSHACVEQEQVPTFNFVAIIERVLSRQKGAALLSSVVSPYVSEQELQTLLVNEGIPESQVGTLFASAQQYIKSNKSSVNYSSDRFSASTSVLPFNWQSIQFLANNVVEVRNEVNSLVFLLQPHALWLLSLAFFCTVAFVWMLV